MSDQESRARRMQVASRAERETSLWEWAVAILSALVVAASIGFVFYKAMTNSGAPPKITVAVDRIVETGNGYVVEFWAINHGETTAKDLAIESQLLDGAEEVVARSTSITFVPDGSGWKGGLFFPVDPRRYELRLYPVGYDRP